MTANACVFLNFISFCVLIGYLEKLVVVQFETFGQLLLEVSDIRAFIIWSDLCACICSEHSVTGMV